MLMIKSAGVYSPKFIGRKDVLISEGKIIYISEHIDIPDKNFPEIKVIDGSGMKMIPGLIDLHVHIIGGGGEGGYHTRTPELNLTSFTLNGITTCVGLLGTDGTTRNMANLIAKSRALDFEGITTHTWTGCYRVPTRTVTDSPRDDIVLVDKIIGIGEVAVSDQRGSHPSEESLAFLASEARVGGMLSGKCGILHMHLGDGRKGLQPVMDLVEDIDMPYENLLPTHVNRNKRVYAQSIEYAKGGGYVDITTGIKPEGDDAVEPWKAYSNMLKEGVDPEHITMSSDAGGSMPIFDDTGRLLQLKAGLPNTNIECIRECINLGMSLEEAIQPLTSSSASLLKFNEKGRIAEGFDADLILLDEKLNIHTVIAKGIVVASEYKAVKYGTFEQ